MIDVSNFNGAEVRFYDFNFINAPTMRIAYKKGEGQWLQTLFLVIK